jgi:thiamine transport system substrate-binding protein
MYVYPVDTTVALPEGWQTWAPTSPDPVEVSAADISEHRAEWLRDWRDVTSR